MLKMVERQEIIHLYRVDGMSIRSISKELHRSRKAVSKVIREYEHAISSPNSDDSLEEVLVRHPHYDSSKRKAYRMTDEIKAAIDDCLRKNAVKNATGMRKQRMLKCDIHQHLLSLGFTISYPSVCNYIRASEKPRPSTKAYIRQSYTPGYGVEFDWGEVKLLIDGKRERLYIAVFTFQYSNARYSYLFRHQDSLAYMESHRDFFHDIHGVPCEMVYDNMSVAVKRIAGHEKSPTESTLRLASFYSYNYRFCNVRAGWEKGHVERSVEYVRRKAFCTRDSFTSVSEAQAHLSECCTRMNEVPGSLSTMNKRENTREDLSALRKLNGDIGCFYMEELSVDKWATATFRNSHYSVPDSLVGNRVQVKVYSEKLVFFHSGKKIAVHERAFKSGTWRIDIRHYLATMERKPGSIHSSEALRQAPEPLRNIFDRYFHDTPKDFVSLLLYMHDNGHSYTTILDICGRLKAGGLRRISADHVKAALVSDLDAGADTAERDVQCVEIEESAGRTLDMITCVMAHGQSHTN